MVISGLRLSHPVNRSAQPSMNTAESATATIFASFLPNVLIILPPEFVCTAHPPIGRRAAAAESFTFTLLF